MLQSPVPYTWSKLLFGSIKEVQGAYKLSEDFSKPHFHKYWTKIHDVTTIWKRNVCIFHSDYKCIPCAQHVWHGRCPWKLPILPNPLKRSRLRCWCALEILVVPLVVVGRKDCPWRNLTGKKHTVRSCDRGSQVQVFSVAAARQTHRPGMCSFRYSRTSLCQCGGARLVSKCTPVVPHPRVDINQFSNMPRYTFPVTLSSAKNGPNTRLLEMAPHSSLWDCHVPSWSDREDSGIPISGYCACWFFRIKRVASSLKMTRSDKPCFVSILLRKSSQNASHLDGSSVWSFCTSCSLYGYNCSRFRRIFLTVCSGIFNSRLALRTDFMGLRVKVSRTLSTVSSVTLGLPTRPFPWWQMKLFIPTSDRRLRRTTTFKLPSEHALNRHKTVTSRKFLDTNYARSVRQPFPSNIVYAFPARWQ